MTRRMFPQRAWGIIALVAAVLLGMRLSFAAVSDQQLFEAGKLALEQDNPLDATMYLFAYQQRAPAILQQNVEHASQVAESITFSRGRLQYVIDHERALAQEVRDLKIRLGEPVGASVSGMTFRPKLDTPAPTSSTSYPMVCRGGATKFEVIGEGFGLTGPTVVVEFRRAAGAGAGALAPGECSWLDRTINAAEPTRICDPIEPAQLHVEWGTDGALRGFGSRSAQYLPRMITSDEVLTFRVFNNNRGCMVATGTPVNPARGRGRGRGAR